MKFGQLLDTQDVMLLESYDVKGVQFFKHAIFRVGQTCVQKCISRRDAYWTVHPEISPAFISATAVVVLFKRPGSKPMTKHESLERKQAAMRERQRAKLRCLFRDRK